MNLNNQAMSGSELRKLVRTGHFQKQTSGQAPDFIQGNIVILSRRYASDFLQFCLNNPKPCPLIGLSSPGNPLLPMLGNDIDIRTDVPRYRIYRNGKLKNQAIEITALWSDDLVTFVLGCSFTFEKALENAGYTVRHIAQGCNVPMFKSNIKTLRGGIFNGPLVVSMRPYKARDIPAIFDICARFPHAHGTPVYWGNPKKIGIHDLAHPEYGDAVLVKPDEIPVFWACGVTPQAAIEKAKLDFCITHAPGHMLVTDIVSDQVIEPISGMQDFCSQ